MILEQALTIKTGTAVTFTSVAEKLLNITGNDISCKEVYFVGTIIHRNSILGPLFEIKVKNSRPKPFHYSYLVVLPNFKHVSLSDLQSISELLSI